MDSRASSAVASAPSTMASTPSTRLDTRPTSVSTRFGASAAMAGVSAGWFYFYAMSGSRGEWQEILLDYCHHKRTQYSPVRTDAVVRNLFRFLKVVPK